MKVEEVAEQQTSGPLTEASGPFLEAPQQQPTLFAESGPSAIRSTKTNGLSSRARHVLKPT
jgi:hypothetical protein